MSIAVVISLVLQALTLVTVAVFLFHLLKSHGRLLLRLDSLERGASGLMNITTEPAGPPGLALGTAIEDFQLPDVDGKTVALSDFRGKKVLLFFWGPDCGFCDMAAEELAPLQDDLKKHNTELVLLAYGDAQANKKLAEERKLKATILLIENTRPQKFIEGSVFAFCGTPSAYLLDEQGRVTGALATGSDSIMHPARSAMTPSPQKLALRPLRESRIEREGLKAGAAAPSFTLPAVDGKTVSLDQFRGRKVLLVFSDPQCGPCDELAPQLARLHRKHGNNGLAVVMVGRGDPEQNRKKAAEHGITFPVVLQERWKLSREYGIFATPVAFLISNNGLIMKNVATGADEILSLAHEGLTST